MSGESRAIKTSGARQNPSDHIHWVSGIYTPSVTDIHTYIINIPIILGKSKKLEINYNIQILLQNFWNWMYIFFQ